MSYSPEQNLRRVSLLNASSIVWLLRTSFIGGLPTVKSRLRTTAHARERPLLDWPTPGVTIMHALLLLRSSLTRLAGLVHTYIPLESMACNSVSPSRSALAAGGKSGLADSRRITNSLPLGLLL